MVSKWAGSGRDAEEPKDGVEQPDGCQNSCKNLYLGVSHTRGYCNWEWVISLCTAHCSLENIKIPPWGLGLLQGGSRSKAVRNSAALLLFLNSQNYVVSVLASSCYNTFPEALVIFLGITKICPPVVRSGAAPWSLQQVLSLLYNLLSSHQQWICPFVKRMGDIRASCPLLSVWLSWRQQLDASPQASPMKAG